MSTGPDNGTPLHAGTWGIVASAGAASLLADSSGNVQLIARGPGTVDHLIVNGIVAPISACDSAGSCVALVRVIISP